MNGLRRERPTASCASCGKFSFSPLWFLKEESIRSNQRFARTSLVLNCRNIRTQILRNSTKCTNETQLSFILMEIVRCCRRRAAVTRPENMTGSYETTYYDRKPLTQS